jgi:hypothetical protein
MQPLSEWQMTRLGRKDLVEALRLADPATGADRPEDELLGAAGLTAGDLPAGDPPRSLGA